MERLNPILKQKFWILLGIGLIMTVTSWWVATAGMKATISSRIDEITKAFESIPKTKIPSEKWTNELKSINQKQTKANSLARAKLWQNQFQAMMEWPDEMRPLKLYAGPIGTAAADSKERLFENDSKEAFRVSIFEEEVTKVWKSLHPIQPDGTGIVDYPLNRMYDLLRRYPEWPGTEPIKDQEIWHVKEDLMLLQSLFQSIAAVNGGEETQRTVEMVHTIDILELRGGGDKQKSTALTGAGATSGTTEEFPAVKADFNPIEEFGDDGSIAQPRPDQKTTVPTIATNGRSEKGVLGGLGGGATMITKPPVENKPSGTAAKPGKPIERYVLKDDKGPFKTRGFYLSVRMDHRKIPQLLAELTANDRSKWPIEIVRVQMARIHEDSQKGMEPTRPALRTNAAEDTLMNRRSQTPDNANDQEVEANEQAIISKASYEKALSNPNIAQVAICGVFMLYQKVADEDKPAISTPLVKTPGPPATVQIEPEPKTESNTLINNSQTVDDSAGKSEQDSSSKSVAETTMETDKPTTEVSTDIAPSSDTSAGIENTSQEPSEKKDDDKK